MFGSGVGSMHSFRLHQTEVTCSASHHRSLPPGQRVSCIHSIVGRVVSTSDVDSLEKRKRFCSFQELNSVCVVATLVSIGPFYNAWNFLKLELFLISAIFPTNPDHVLLDLFLPITINRLVLKNSVCKRPDALRGMQIATLAMRRFAGRNIISILNA